MGIFSLFFLEDPKSKQKTRPKLGNYAKFLFAFPTLTDDKSFCVGAGEGFVFRDLISRSCFRSLCFRLFSAVFLHQLFYSSSNAPV